MTKSPDSSQIQVFNPETRKFVERKLYQNSENKFAVRLNGAGFIVKIHGDHAVIVEHEATYCNSTKSPIFLKNLSIFSEVRTQTTAHELRRTGFGEMK